MQFDFVAVIYDGRIGVCFDDPHHGPQSESCFLCYQGVRRGGSISQSSSIMSLAAGIKLLPVPGCQRPRSRDHHRRDSGQNIFISLQIYKKSTLQCITSLTLWATRWPKSHFDHTNHSYYLVGTSELMLTVTLQPSRPYAYGEPS